MTQQTVKEAEFKSILYFAHDDCPRFGKDRADIPCHTLAIGLQKHADGSITILGNKPDLITHAINHMGGMNGIKHGAAGVRLPSAQAHRAISFPLLVEKLPSGVELHYFWLEEHGLFGVSVTAYKDMPYSGIAANVQSLMFIVAEDHGDDFHKEIFGVSADPEAIANYEAEQAAIQARKDAHQQALSAQRIQAALNCKISGTSLTDEERALVNKIKAETSQAVEAQRQETWASTIQRGIVENPRYQCFLDTVEDLSAITTNAPFMGWLDARVAEYSKLEYQHNITLMKGLNSKARKQYNKQPLPYTFDQYLQQYTNKHKAVRLMTATNLTHQ